MRLKMINGQKSYCCSMPDAGDSVAMAECRAYAVELMQQIAKFEIERLKTLREKVRKLEAKKDLWEQSPAGRWSMAKSEFNLMHR